MGGTNDEPAGQGQQQTHDTQQQPYDNTTHNHNHNHTQPDHDHDHEQDWISLMMGDCTTSVSHPHDDSFCLLESGDSFSSFSETSSLSDYSNNSHSNDQPWSDHTDIDWLPQEETFLDLDGGERVGAAGFALARSPASTLSTTSDDRLSASHSSDLDTSLVGPSAARALSAQSPYDTRRAAEPHDVATTAASRQPRRARGPPPASAPAPQLVRPGGRGAIAKARRKGKGLPPQRQRQKKKKGPARKAPSDLMSFEEAHKLLVGDGQIDYPHRPYRARALPTRQIFIERPPSRRQWGGGDKWRNSGGQRGGVVVWVTARSGVRKRYGALLREDRLNQLKFQQYSLVSRKSESAPVVEDPSVYMYVVEPCAAHEVDEKEPSPQRGASEPAAASVPACAASQAHGRGWQAAVKTATAARANSTVAVLDFGELARSQHQQPRSREPLHTLMGKGMKPQRPSRRPRTWPLGKATLVAASLLLIAVVAYVGLLRRAPGDVSADSGCPANTYRPPGQLLAHCMPCTVCALHGLVTLRACTAVSDARCGRWGWTRSTADVHIPPWTAVPGPRASRAPTARSAPASADGTQHSGPVQRQHLPQFSASWENKGILYSFGGAGDTRAVGTAASRLRMSGGERCVAQATGIMDELWTYQPAEGWNRIASDVRDQTEAETQGQGTIVWPRRRYAATSWGLEDGRGVIFSGEYLHIPSLRLCALG